MFFRAKKEPGAPVERLRAAPLQVLAAGEDLAFVRRTGEPGGGRIAPMFVAEFLESCRTFRTVEQHLQAFAVFLEESPLQAESLRSWVPQLREWGFFLTEAERPVPGSAGSSEPACRLSAIAVPTANRPAMLARMLESFGSNLEKHGRKLPFLVADSSADPAVAQENARVVERARTEGLEVRYFDAAAKAVMIDRLARASGVEREVVEFALLDTEGCGFATGANRNFLLLALAGRAFASVDDDVLCEFGAPEEPVANLTLFAGGVPYERRYFGTRAEALTRLRPVEADFAGLHETLLGRTVAEAQGQFPETDRGEVPPAARARDPRADPRVRFSFSGHYGDSTLYSSCYLLFGPERDFHRLTESEAHYRAVMNGRNSAVAVPGWCVGDLSSAPGMAMALDGREVLPPFFPVFHFVIYGQTVGLCAPSALAAHFPLAIRHDPPGEATPVRPGDLALVPSVIFEFSHLLREVQGRWAAPPGALSTEAGLVRLGRYLVELASIAEEDFDEYLRKLAFRAASRSVQASDRAISEFGHLADFWQRDVETWRDYIRQSALEPDFEIPRELKTNGRGAEENRRLIQRLLLRYGKMLEAWPALWRAAEREALV